MANLRTNNLSGEQGQNAIRGAVNFGGYVDGSASDYLSVADHDDLDMGTGDFTFECWLLATEHIGPNTPNPMGIISSQSWTAGGILIQVRGADDPSGVLRVTVPLSGGGYLDVNGTTNIYNTQPMRNWNHIAVVRTSGTIKGYVNGIEEISTSYSVAVDFAHGGTCTIAENGYDQYPGDYPLRGTISNLRLTKGLARYTSTFTPPAFELTADADTVLLCCQNSDDVTQEETGKTITGVGNLATAGYNKTQPKVIPPYGVDAGNTFGGSIQQSSQGYMYFPTGRTEERGGTRGLAAGGSDGNELDEIQFVNIASEGNAIQFGNLSVDSHNVAGMSSKTRAVFSLGYVDASPNISNVIEFVTIMTQGNATDFGDTSFNTYESGAVSNDTRGLVAGGYDGSGSGTPNNTEQIDFITIASLGNGADFGDLTLGRRGLSGCGSPTRGVFAAGYQQPDTSTKTNVIDFVTIATAGNAQDFGDLTSQRWGTAACSDSTRGVFSGGATPGVLNVIDFITIATTGNAADFGDLVTAAGRSSATSDRIRGVIFSGYSPSVNNIIEVLTIQTTGNSKDFGDTYKSTHSPGTASNAHGGLS